MKYLRRHSLNSNNILDDTVLQRADGNIEFNPTQRVIINGEVIINGPGGAPGPEVSNVMYVTVDGNDDNDGFGEGASQAKRTIKAACLAAQQGTTIFVRSGEYYEDNPIRIPPKVSIMGDNLRRVIVRPLNGPETFTIVAIEKTSEMVTVTLAEEHGLDLYERVRVRCSDDRIDDEATIIGIPDANTVVYRQTGPDILPILAGGTVKWGPDLFLVNSQNYLNGMVFKGLAAPAYCINIDKDAIVDTSPYIQNCSNINGPFLKNGIEWLPFITQQPDLTGTMVSGARPLRDDEIDPTQLAEYSVDVEGAGGGMLIDGDRYSSESPIKSMVGDAFTQISQGGIGFHITNFGYMQLVSCFAVFCSKAFYTTKGGYLSISNSVVDFGTEGFVADGYYQDPYGTGLLTQDYYSTAGSVTVSSGGAGYTGIPSVLIAPPTSGAPGAYAATATASIDSILGIVNAITIDDPGYGYDDVPEITISGGGATSDAVALVNLQKNLSIEVSELGNKPQVGSIMFLGDDPTGYYVLDTSGATLPFKYDEQKCSRDVGLILNAVLTDMVFGSNQQSIYAGLSYLRSYSSKVTSLQKAQTIFGLEQAKAQTLFLTTDPTAIARITSGFDTVIDILSLGAAVAPIISSPEPATPNPGYYQAAQILQANKEFLKDEIINWISDNYPTFTYNSTKCARDVGLIINAVIDDAIFGTNYRSITAGLSYIRSYSSTVTSAQKNQTIDGINRAKSLVLAITTDRELEEIVIANFKIITDIIDDVNDSSVPELTYTTSLSAGSGVSNAVKVLQANKEFLKTEITSWINYNILNETAPFTGGFNYNSSKCARDVGYVVDAVCYDVLYGGNSATYHAAETYYLGATSYIEDQEEQTVAAYNRLKDIIGDVARNVLITPTEGNTLVQNTSLNAGSAPAAVAVESLMDVVIDIVLDGTTLIVKVDPTHTDGIYYADWGTSRNAVVAAESTIKSTVISYLDDKYATPYNETTCRRDIGYILDAVAYDLTYGGNSQTVNAAQSYGDGSVLNGEIEETKEAYEYWKSIVGLVVKNIAVDTSVTGQNTSGSLGSPLDQDGPAKKAENLLQIIIDVIDHGPGYIPDPVDFPEYSRGTPSLVSIRETIIASTSDIQSGTIDAINATYGGNVTVTTFPPITSVTTGTEVNYHNVSTISTASTALEYVGAGVTYNALPFFGGEPIPANERVEINNGKCFTVTNDQVGNYKIGEFFTVNALSGEITIDAEKLNLSGLASIGPFRRNGIPVGVALREVSNNANLISSTGAADANTVPTQPAVQTYVENRYLNKVQSTTPQTVQSQVEFEADVSINGGDLVTSSEEFNLLNTDALTVNFAGEATEINIGSVLGTTNINHDLVVAGNTTLGSDTLDSTEIFGTITSNLVDNTVAAFNILQGTDSLLSVDTSTGAYRVAIGTGTAFNVENTADAVDSITGSATFAGGVGIAKKLFVGTDFDVDGSTTLGTDKTTDTLMSYGVSTFEVPSNEALAFRIKVDADPYLTADSTTGTESIIIGERALLSVLNETDSVDKDTGALIVEGGVGIAKNLTVGANLTVDVDTVITGDLAVNGGDLTTTETTFNLLNTTATIVNFAGAATDVQIGAATGITNINNDLDVDGDVNIDGGDLTVSTATFNLVNTIATTVNFAGAATTLTLGAATGTTTIRNANVVLDGDLQVKGGDLTTDQTTFNLLSTAVTTGNVFDIATAINLATNAAAASTLSFGPALSNNTLEINSTAAGTVNLTSDVTSGIVNLFTGVTTGTINVGGNGSTVNIDTLTLASDLAVQYGGTGRSTFTENGIIYGNTTDGLLVTSESTPGSNATTSYGILTTDINNVPVWTDVVDGGSY